MLTLLCACSGIGLAEKPPDNYSLAGTWKLNPALSTDSHKAMQDLQRARVRAVQRDEEIEGRESSPVGSGQGRGGGSGGGGGPGYGQGLDRPIPPDISLQSGVLRGGNWLRIDQHEDQITISNGDTTHSFVAGEKSVVSVPSGVADQHTGWKGKEFRIEIHPQLGPRVSQHFRLSDDGKRLIETIYVASEGRVPAVSITRVYDPTTELPQNLPGGD